MSTPACGGLARGTPWTMPSRRMLMQELRDRVARQEYDVDCGLVAEAFLARHSVCWNPSGVRAPVMSLSSIPGVPARTRPTGRRPGRSGGPQAHSS